MTSRLKLFFDGGYRPLENGMETAVVLRGRTYTQRNLGPGTSEGAEWLALIEAMRLVRQERLADVQILGDSLSVIGQVNGTAKRRDAARRHLAEYLALASAGPPPRIRYIKRTQNLAGIALSRLHLR